VAGQEGGVSPGTAKRKPTGWLERFFHRTKGKPHDDQRHGGDVHDDDDEKPRR
jgi:hypothetical protein